MFLSQCKMVEIPKIADSRGNLSFVEGNLIPFDIRRVYYLYDIPAGAERGGHAHIALESLIIPLSGSFDVIVKDGISEKRFHLNRPYSGLYLCPMVWRELENFSSGAVALVLASNKFDEADYYRDYSEYLHAMSGPK